MGSYDLYSAWIMYAVRGVAQLGQEKCSGTENIPANYSLSNTFGFVVGDG
ncbi:hypothetical protein [Bifidobacterium longum]|nr:hypothetical protein [Bifidobacterium longum]